MFLMKKLFISKLFIFLIGIKLQVLYTFETKYFEEFGTIRDVLNNMKNLTIRKDSTLFYSFLHKNRTVLDYTRPSSNPDNFFNVYHEDKTYKMYNLPKDFNYTEYMMNTNVNASDEGGNLFFYYNDLKLPDHNFNETFSVCKLSIFIYFDKKLNKLFLLKKKKLFSFSFPFF
jgi:hypothetical protein